MFLYKKRDINGFLLIDKPIGISSNNTLQQVKSIFKARKAGYIGTLDPLASGMLPVCFGESTKFSCYLNNSDKKYNVIAKLGEKTSTFDSDGIIIKKRTISFTHIELDKALKELTGSVNQIPSMYSAIKYNGIPLYRYARQGLNIPRNIRHIKIYKLNLIEQKNNLIELNVHCSKGTYIRTLIDDLGEKLGCGAHVVFLRRIQVGLLSCSKLVTISYLKELSNKDNIKKLDSLLMPIDTPIYFLPKVYLSNKESFEFKLGKKVNFKSDIKNSLVRVLENEKKVFLGLGKIYTEEILVPYRLISMCTN
ncbi:tRNA pseudouridine(55) synthase TruB [Buchnera aphidicola (Aphis fabae)]|uniref:tRNA pseudouridine synthase B n=1 Tax=Buchnera aphidicola (Aphis fabae) TaxID=571430 RepID=A0A5J6ZEH2_9GAMM|nr:tRNA pseudouridine(55) synthase TruB [Buchnera aphidicola]QFQ32545.1 tRNA pseudouridine(55) synthase TruB [Buchnera aphidicola (Aphis fabae)]